MAASNVVRFHVRGTVPTIMHNGQMSDPMNRYAIALKEISGNHKKTEADLIEMARIEHEGSLYLDDAKQPCWPASNIKSMIVDASKKSKNGKNAKAGLIVLGDAPLIYKGPKTADGLWKDPEFVDRRCVRVKTNRIQRTRPIFKQWELEFEVEFLPDVCSRKNLCDWVQIAGRLIGLSDFRPEYGRFIVLSEQDVA